jgi:hypothetical protein
VGIEAAGARRQPLQSRGFGVKRPEAPAEREHFLDRAIIAAVYRREQAKAGRGYKFKAPRGAVSTSPDSQGVAK